MRIDFINGLDYDFSLWYQDGKYVGHDDQYSAEDFASPTTSVTVEFHHRMFKDGLDWEDIQKVFGAENLADLEPYLREANSWR